MNGELAQLQRKVQRLNTVVVILAEAINTRPDRDVTLGDETLGITVDLLADGNMADAINYYEHAKGH